jgi:hypothetical protein
MFFKTFIVLAKCVLTGGNRFFAKISPVILAMYAKDDECRLQKSGAAGAHCALGWPDIGGGFGDAGAAPVVTAGEEALMAMIALLLAYPNRLAIPPNMAMTAAIHIHLG